jgi:hypothetical protein
MGAGSTMTSRLIAPRKRRPRWRPRKMFAWLEDRKPHLKLPAASTVGDLLKREGHVRLCVDGAEGVANRTAACSSTIRRFQFYSNAPRRTRHVATRRVHSHGGVQVLLDAVNRSQSGR